MREEITIDSVIHYDGVEVIYYTNESHLKPKAFCMSLEWQEEVNTYRELLTHIQSQEKEKIHSAIIIAERGLDGVVVRWNDIEGNK